MSTQAGENTKIGGGLVFKIIYIAGIVVSLCALFMPAQDGKILEQKSISNLFQAFTGKDTDGTAYVTMLFGHGPADPIGMPSIVLDIMISFLPAALLAAAAVLMFAAPKKKLALILGVVGAVMIMGRDMYLFITDTDFFGVYMSITGMVIAMLGLLLFYIGKEEGEYAVAGVITCRSGSFAGSTFEVSDQVVIGKNPRECNIVLNNRTISRVHCIIKYLEDSDSYTVKDVSTNGTYLSDGRRFAKNYEAHVERGTEIYMGDPRETFYLD